MNNKLLSWSINTSPKFLGVYLTLKIHLLFTCWKFNLIDIENLTGHAIYIYLLNLATLSFRPSILLFACHLFIAFLFLSPQPLKRSDCVLFIFVPSVSKPSPAFSRCSVMCLLDKDSTKAYFLLSQHCTSGAPSQSISTTFQVQVFHFVS